MEDIRQLIVHSRPKSVGSEAFRTLRTNLQFANPDASLTKILITSAGPGEGKSTITANLAASIAQTGEEVILVDCDLRKPVIHKIFQLPNIRGVSSILAGQTTVDDCLQQTEVPGLRVLTAGPTPPNPADLLQSNRMQKLIDELETRSSKLLVDTAPVIPVADAMVLAPRMDGVVLVVAAYQVPKDIVAQAKGLLEKTNCRILGVVLNKLRYDRDNTQYYYNYYTDSV